MRKRSSTESKLDSPPFPLRCSLSSCYIARSPSPHAFTRRDNFVTFPLPPGNQWWTRGADSERRLTMYNSITKNSDSAPEMEAKQLSIRQAQPGKSQFPLLNCTWSRGTVYTRFPSRKLNYKHFVLGLHIILCVVHSEALDDKPTAPTP